MKLKTLLAVAVAGAFALPFAAQASVDGDRMILAQAGGPSGSSATGTGPTGGTATPQTAGEPKAAAGEVSSTATKRCETMTGLERETCLRDARAATPGAATGGASTAPATTTSPSTSTVSPSGSGTTGATAGPGSASNRTAPSSDTATSPSTSGQGKPR